MSSMPSSSFSHPSNQPPQQQPSLSWRMTSSLVMGLTASLSRVFLYGLNTVEVTGLQRFIEILDQRKDIVKRQKGLITGGHCVPPCKHCTLILT
jgi:monolysocardiolipin acyltransferase